MEEELISLVYHNICLWDKKNKDFKNNNKKQQIWQDISAHLKISDAEEIFKSLRSKYIREKKNLEKTSRSGAAAQTRKEWPWMQHLKFLDDVIAPRRTFSSFKRIEEGTGEQMLDKAGPSQDTDSISESQLIETEVCVEDILLSPTEEHNYTSASEHFTEGTMSPTYSIPFTPAHTVQRFKQKKRKIESNYQSVDCPQMSELAAALTAPISFATPAQPSTRWDDGVDVETKLFTQYLAVRLNNLPVADRRNFEQKIMKDLTELETKTKTPQ